MKIKGRVKLIKETETFGANGFRKREVIIETERETQYPQELPVEFTQDKCNVLDSYKIGDEVEISVNARGRSWLKPGSDEAERRWFLSFQGWKINKLSESAPTPQVEQDDDIPF